MISVRCCYVYFFICTIAILVLFPTIYADSLLNKNESQQFFNGNEFTNISINSNLVKSFSPSIMSASNTDKTDQLIAGDIIGFGGNELPAKIQLLQFFLRPPENIPLDLTQISFYLSDSSGISQISPSLNYTDELSPGEWNFSSKDKIPVLDNEKIGTFYLMPEKPIVSGERFLLIIDTGYDTPLVIANIVPSLISLITPILTNSENPVYDFESFGSIYGYDLQDSGEINQIEIPLRLTAGRDPINMSDVLVVISNDRKQMILPYDRSQSSGTWHETCLFCNSNLELEEGELWILNLRLSSPFMGGDKIHLQIIPVDSASFVTNGYVPTFSDNVTELPLGIPSSLKMDAPIIENRVVELVGVMYGIIMDKTLQNITFHLAIPENSNSVDLSKVQISYSTNNSIEWLHFSENTPLNGQWGITEFLSGDDDSILKNGEIIDITVVPTKKILAGEQFTLQLLPDAGKGYYVTGYFMDQGYNLTFISPVTYGSFGLVLDGQIYGCMDSDQLTKLRLYLYNPEGSYPINLANVEFLWSSPPQSLPVKLNPDYSPEKQYLSGGDRAQINLTIGSNQGRISPGESFTLEIKPDEGASTLFSRTLSTGYNGGVII